jgi:hypothetical protein
MRAMFAQSPVITSIIPMANARAAVRTSSVTVNFNQSLTPASAGALKVFSSQRGGLRTRGATPAVVSGSALSFAPTTYPFVPGETVQYTVTTAAASSSGPLATARVGQFTTAVGGTGNGNFQAGSTPSVGSEPTYILTGDVDGDGDQDLVNNLVNSPFIGIRLNNGAGAFSGNQSFIPIPNPANSVSLGDVDGDGDLDLVAATRAFSGTAGAINVRLKTEPARLVPGPTWLLPGPLA